MATSSRLAREYSFGKLYDYLMTTFPRHRSEQGVLDVPRLAADLGRSHEGIYKWLRENRITVDGAKKIIALSEGKAKAKDFIEFLFA